MMESTQKRAEQVATPLKSAVGDVRRMKTGSSASVQELKDFLRQHRGKSSQELLGELGKTSLFQAMVKSTLGCLALLAVLTLVPFFTAGEPETKKATAKPAVAAPQPAPTAAVLTPTAAADASGAPAGVDVEKAQKVLGLDETKSAPADVNPREKDLDNLLDGVK